MLNRHIADKRNRSGFLLEYELVVMFHQRIDQHNVLEPDTRVLIRDHLLYDLVECCLGPISLHVLVQVVDYKLHRSFANLPVLVLEFT